MPNPRLVAIITALALLAGTRGGYAAYTLDQLREIESLILSKDCGALRGYIDRNPGLLVGDDPLAVELRSFASGVDTGLIECISATAPQTVTRAAPIAAGAALY